MQRTNYINYDELVGKSYTKDIVVSHLFRNKNYKQLIMKIELPHKILFEVRKDNELIAECLELKNAVRAYNEI